MKKILSLLVAVMMMLACAVPAFAEDGDDDTPSVVRIPEGTKVVTSSTLDDGIIDRLRVKTIYVPSSVTTIKEGALTGYANVTNVYVENSKDNITIENGALPTGTNIVYTEKPTPPPSTTTTTKKSEESTTKKDEESTTKKDEESTTKKTTTTKKGETTKKTTKKTTKRTVSSSATTSNPKDRTTVQHRPLTIPSTKATKKTTVKGPLIPEVEVDPEEIEEQPDPTMEAETTTVTFAGEAITDKDGTIIGFEDPQTSRSETDRSARRAKIITGIAVGVVGLTSAAFAFLKLRKRP
jgi:hypothetical protein